MTAQINRNRYAKGEARREAILAVALECFAELGYRNTSMREVARRAGLSQAGLLHHFPAKEDLFLAVLRERQQIDTRDYHGEADAIGSLIRAVRRNATIPGLVRLYMTLLGEVPYSDDAREYFVGRYDLARSLISREIEQGQRDGTVRPDLDPRTAAQALIAVADGMQVQWLLDEDQQMADAVEFTWQLMAHQ
ncbi:TetR/AcrR family transcriptional regulator [Kineosporia sp. J2-2]|uniref:TetR/AcrR family transcriptional regulator n=1 Tax=Kineosporia corallincola TaxID=2835133 RepID=A0ABS5TDF3_9ACTN|nr:TetR/AcrR family transcriptional regulator [Kineosporia corallincola]MBT0769115.1 TetR/AcrR family transcriptional regulator [Kineosporia corallincola]